jgi:membrane-bound lytic murein transglycosylase C
MKQYMMILILIFSGCSTSDYTGLASAVVSKNPSYALESFARNKSIQYALNPKLLEKDLKYLANFVENIKKEWGGKNVKIPKQKEYVKYMQNYKSRALVDFDNGIVRVENLDSKESLKNAIVTTLLLPDDPRGADLFSAKKVKLGSTPYLLGEIKDDQGKNIRYQWRANRFAGILLKTRYKVKKENGKTIHYVTIPMVKDHVSVRVKKFKPIVEKYAKKFGVSKNLVYAIIKTESNFNQFAISSAGAYGLMQIVPRSAGRDAYKSIKKRSWIPSKEYLFEAKNNIELGVAYIKLLSQKYFLGIKNPISKEYCVISAYNTGSGNVLKVFHKDRDRAKQIINSYSPNEIYTRLRRYLPYEETRRYLYKVLHNKKDFINI